MIFQENKELLDRLSEMKTLEMNDLLSELLKREKLDFIELSKMYVRELEKSNKEKSASINTLGLMLGMYCMTDTSRTGKTARKHLYESGMYGHNDGSKFGEMLDEEFSKESDNDIKIEL